MDLEHNVFQEWTLIASVPISKEKKNALVPLSKKEKIMVKCLGVLWNNK